MPGVGKNEPNLNSTIIKRVNINLFLKSGVLKAFPKVLNIPITVKWILYVNFLLFDKIFYMQTGKKLPPYFIKAVMTTILLIVSTFIVFSLIIKLKKLLLLILISFFISLVLEPIVNILERKKIKRGVSTCGLIIVVLGMFIGLFYEFGTLLVGQISQLIQNFPNYYSQLDKWVNSTFHIRISDQLGSIKEALASWSASTASNIVSTSTNILSSILFGLGAILIVFYLTAQGQKFRQIICSPLPEKQQLIVLKVWKIAQQKTSYFILSRVFLAVINTILLLIFLLILNIPYAFALAIFTGVVSQFVPTIGTYIGGALPVLIAFTVKPIYALFVLIYIIVYQQIENYFIQPKISSEMLNINPAIAFISVIAFTYILGPIGAFLALPIVATAQAVISTYI